MRVLAVQMGAAVDKEENVRRLQTLLGRARESVSRVDMIVLPELWLTLPNAHNVGELAERREDFLQRMGPIAREHGATVVAGSYAEKDPDGKVYNTCLVLNPNGVPVASYRKRRLFSALGRDESRVMAAGPDRPVMVTVNGVQVGLLICYELRFPELAAEMVRQGAEVLAIPSAFYSPRDDHWQKLLEGTALTNLCYVAAANQYANRAESSRHFCGRSAVVDPWGVSVATASDRDCVIFAELDFDYLADVRQRVATVKVDAAKEGGRA